MHQLRRLLLACALLCGFGVRSQEFLKTDLLFVGAHPDDETGVASTLAYFARGEKRSVACIYCTRGEGGGNMIGRQSGAALGSLREAELRDAMQIVGVRRIYFLDQLDWAYTESLSATLTKWGHEETLGRLVRLIRLLKPEVIITMNPAPTPGQHGHHQAAGVLATEAFTAAADPLRFPLQLSEEGLAIWQPRKLYYGGSGSTATPVHTDLPLSDGKYPGEYAGEAMSHHHSQAFGDMRNSPWMRRAQSFALVRSAVLPMKTETNLFDNLPGYDSGAAPFLWMLTSRPYFLPLNQPAFWTWKAVSLTNALIDLSVGWRDSHESRSLQLSAGQSLGGKTELTPRAGADTNQTLSVTFNGREIYVPIPVQIVPSERLEFEPRPTVANYRVWTAQQGTEAVAASFQPDLPVVAGEMNRLTLWLRSSNSAGAITPQLNAPQGWIIGRVRKASDHSWSIEVTPPATASEDVTLEATLGTANNAQARLHPIPSARVPKAAATLAWNSATLLDITTNQLVQGNHPTRDDFSGEARLAYDKTFLHVQVLVRDDHVISNIAPDDIKGHWRSDSVEICIDPKPGSEATMGCYKVGIFPFDSTGHVRAARDADANPGPVEQSSPTLKLLSTRTADGYVIEAAIPWSDIGVKPHRGRELGFNVILYDGDKTNAAPGENINKTRLAWSPRSGVQGRPEDWGRLKLE